MEGSPLIVVKPEMLFQSQRSGIRSYTRLNINVTSNVQKTHDKLYHGEQ